MSKTSTLPVPKFSSNFFSPSVPLGSACGLLGPRAAAPEASHRCIRQPATATFPPSRGLSRPRQRWMRRLRTAVASGRRIWGGKPSWGNGIFTWGSGWNVDSIQGFSWFVFSLFMESVSQNMCATILLCSLVVTIFHNCVFCPPWVVFFCGPTFLLLNLGSVHHSDVTSAFLQVS